MSQQQRKRVKIRIPLRKLKHSHDQSRQGMEGNAKTANEEQKQNSKEHVQQREMVDREDESLMQSAIKHECIKLEKQKDVNVVNRKDETSWILNEKHAISMRHISIRDDRKKMMSLFIPQAVENQQFNFIKKKLCSYLTLNQHRFDDNVFKSIDDSLQLNLLFNTSMDSETVEKIGEIINKLEAYVMENHFEIHKREKTVKFKFQEYQTDCDAIRNKLESCPILYVLLLHGDVDFDVLLSADMTIIAFLCINALIRKKVQRKFETLVKKENAKSLETYLFEYYKKNQKKEFLKQQHQAKQRERIKQTNSKQKADEDDQTDIKSMKEQTSLWEANEHRILHDQYPLFCKRYLQFLGSFPNYRNAIISGAITIHKILVFDEQQLSQPPPLHQQENNNTNNSLNGDRSQKRKHFECSPMNVKRRKLVTSEMNSKEHIIWDGLLINDFVKCNIRMRQIGGKLIWTLPFKHFHPSMRDHQLAVAQHELSIDGRINIVSIIKFIEKLRQHKSRMVLFAEVEGNEFVHQNSYSVLSSQLRVGGTAGVIDFEKQCGILIYIVSSSFLDPLHGMSAQLAKYFEDHKTKLPKTPIFAIIIITMDVYNQVRRKVSKSSKSRCTTKCCQPAQSQASNHNVKRAPPKPLQGALASLPSAPPPKPATNASFPDRYSSMQSMAKQDQEEEHSRAMDIWNQIDSEIEDDVGKSSTATTQVQSLPPPPRQLAM